MFVRIMNGKIRQGKLEFITPDGKLMNVALSSDDLCPSKNVIDGVVSEEKIFVSRPNAETIDLDTSENFYLMTDNDDIVASLIRGRIKIMESNSLEFDLKDILFFNADTSIPEMGNYDEKFLVKTATSLFCIEKIDYDKKDVILTKYTFTLTDDQCSLKLADKFDSLSVGQIEYLLAMGLAHNNENKYESGMEISEISAEAVRLLSDTAYETYLTISHDLSNNKLILDLDFDNEVVYDYGW